jgi:hypothetical protein
MSRDLFRMLAPTAGSRQYVSIVLAGVSIILLGCFVFFLAQQIGRLDCKDCKPNEVAKAISDARTALLQLIVGIAGAGALYFTWQTYLLGREGRTSDNFIKAVDQLGNSAVHARVGGVVGLGRLLRTATEEGDYWPLMDILTAFVRESAPSGQIPRTAKPSEDIQSAINVLARRSHPHIPERTVDSPVDLSQSDLSRLWMAGGHYEHGYFSGSVFVGTELDDARLDFANFDRADLTRSVFRNAKMRHSSVRWVQNADGANFDGADLTAAQFSGSNLTGASFKGADIRDADFREALVNIEALAEASGNSFTKLPPGVPRPKEWY